MEPTVSINTLIAASRFKPIAIHSFIDGITYCITVGTNN